MLHLVHAAHTVRFHLGDGLAKQNEVESWEGLDGRMGGYVAVYLLPGFCAQGIVVAGHEAALIDKGDMPEGHVADDVPLHHFRLVMSVMDDGGKWQGAIHSRPLVAHSRATLAYPSPFPSPFTDGHHCPREIYVMMNRFHIRSGFSRRFRHPYPCTSSWCRSCRVCPPSRCTAPDRRWLRLAATATCAVR